MKILGVRYGHDAGAALVVDGEIVVNIAEERLTRIKNDGSFPYRAISRCLEIAGIAAEEIDCLAIPALSIHPDFAVFFRIPEAIYPPASGNLLKKIKKRLARSLYGPASHGTTLPLYIEPIPLSPRCVIHLCEHHRAHAASAYYTSGLGRDNALVVTMDGRGDGVSAAVWSGEEGKLRQLYKVDGSGSLGWFYSNVTEAMGWRHGSGEWKLMGLAPYGEARPGAFQGFHPEYRDGRLLQPCQFGEFGRWNDHGANHYHGRDAGRLREIVERIGRENAAAEAQRVVEEEAMHFIKPWIARTAATHICCAGGFFLNVKFNQRLWAAGVVQSQWIYPDCGDAGLAVGAALDAFYSATGSKEIGRLESLYLGPEFADDEIEAILNERGLAYRKVDNPAEEAARYLAGNLVVGWFQGRMESGPRALGNRSILMSPLKPENKDIINEKVKYRETFRPFCPSLPFEKRDDYLVKARDEYFMVTSFAVRPDKKNLIPAVVHEDGTARPQMVRREINPLYYDLIRAFGEKTGIEVILNTSFNVRGEPVVCHPREAIRCFFDTGIDVLVLGRYVLEKPAIAKGQ
ncbi:MAG: carbamoyltransferase [Thermodesulfobacteriota bacterium]